VPNGTKTDCSPEHSSSWNASLIESMLYHSKHGSPQQFKILGIGIIAITTRGVLSVEGINAKSVVTRCHRISMSVGSAIFGLAIGVGGIDCDFGDWLNNRNLGALCL
jgi:hypothetical protein